MPPVIEIKLVDVLMSPSEWKSSAQLLLHLASSLASDCRRLVLLNYANAGGAFVSDVNIASRIIVVNANVRG